MQPLKLPETRFTPEVTLDKHWGRFEFYGNFMPENPQEFFGPIHRWFQEYVQTPCRETAIIIKLNYLNTLSQKGMLEVFQILQEIHRQKKAIVIHWFYRTGDDDMRELGEMLSELAKLPFRITPI